MSLARSGTASPRSSGAGRLFDAVAAVITGRDRVSYEGQAAAELEQVADPHETRLLPCPVRNEADGVIIDTPTLFRSVVDRHLAGAAPEELAARFHNALAAALVEAASIVSDKCGLRTVALSGGCFQNALLTDRCTTGLAGADFAVLAHHQVPPNDGGISLGQAVVAGARSAQGIGSC
jgi:hydrogenase maturation protein HypF